MSEQEVAMIVNYFGTEFVRVKDLAAKHVGKEAFMVMVTDGRESGPVFGVVKESYNSETGERQSFQLVSDGDHMALSPQSEDFRVTRDTWSKFYVAREGVRG